MLQGIYENPSMKVKLLSHIWLFVTPWTVAHQAPLSTEFSRQQYCGGLPFPSPGDHPDPGIEPGSPSLQADSLPLSHQGRLVFISKIMKEKLQTICENPSINSQQLANLGIKFTACCLQVLCPFNHNILSLCPLFVLNRCVMKYTKLTSYFERIKRLHRHFFFSNLFVLKFKISIWTKSGLGPQNSGNFWLVIGQ